MDAGHTMATGIPESDELLNRCTAVFIRNAPGKADVF